MLQRSIDIARFLPSTTRFFVLKEAALFALKQSNRRERQQKTSCVMEAVSLAIFLCAFFVFSAEGKVYKHLIVRSHYMLVSVDKSEIMT